LPQAVARDFWVLKQLHGFTPDEVQRPLLSLLGLGDFVLKLAMLPRIASIVT
jgi:hypothetical protein